MFKKILSSILIAVFLFSFELIYNRTYAERLQKAIERKYTYQQLYDFVNQLQNHPFTSRYPGILEKLKISLDNKDINTFNSTMDNLLGMLWAIFRKDQPDLGSYCKQLGGQTCGAQNSYCCLFSCNSILNICIKPDSGAILTSSQAVSGDGSFQPIVCGVPTISTGISSGEGAE